MDDGNGILSKIPGQYVAAANHRLPPPETAAEDTIEVVCEIPGFGKVQLKYKRLRHKRGKIMHYFWGATRATQID